MSRDPLRPPGRRSIFARVLRTIALTVLIAFAVGYLIGTLLRGPLEEPVRYYGGGPSQVEREVEQGEPA